MEKIYMEENKNRSRSFRVVDFSVVLSFVVALFAIISLATFGIVSNQGMDAVSYAAPAGTTTGDSFHFTLGKDSNNKIIKFVGSGDGGAFTVPMYLAEGNTNNPVFCVEHNVNSPGDGDVVQKSDAISDYGLLYILNNSYTNGNPVVPAAESTVEDSMRPYLEEWITQIAIWMYLNEEHGDITASGVSGIFDDSGNMTAPTNNVKVNFIRPSDVAAIKSTTKIDLVVDGAEAGTVYPKSGSTPKNLYEEYVAPLVSRAREVSGNKLLAVVVEDSAISKVEGDKYYQSGKISVHGNPSNDLVNYDVTITGIDGAFIVDEDGKTMAMEAVAKGKAFYVRVPVDKVKTETIRATITATGHFNTLAGNYFVSSENGQTKQKVITVTGTTRDVIAANHVDFVGVPDSGMNTAQTIYFIGLIVLLCGVGIVYANAKPVGQKQQ